MFRLFLTLALGLGATVGNAQTEAAVKAFARDPAFGSLLRDVSAAARRTGRALAALSPADRLRVQKALDRYLKTQSRPSPENLPADLRDVVGVDTAELGRWLRNGKALAGRHPTVRGPAQVGQAVTYGFYQSEYSFSDIDPNACQTEVCQCQADCREEYRVAANQAGYTWIGDSLRHLSPSSFFTNYLHLARKLGELGRELVQCGIDCRGGQLNPGQCLVHEDCDENQYCAKPWGNPYHSCAPKKALGSPCSGDVKCLSGCCKYHFPTNPVQPVCRPADKCD